MDYSPRQIGSQARGAALSLDLPFPYTAVILSLLHNRLARTDDIRVDHPEWKNIGESIQGTLIAFSLEHATRECWVLASTGLWHTPDVYVPDPQFELRVSSFSLTQLGIR